MIQRLAFILGMILLVTACQNKEAPEDIQKTAAPSSVNHEEVTGNESAASPLQSQDEDAPPEYNNERIYAGDELEIVKQMNARMRYLYEQDEAGYMSLFAPEAPVTGMPEYKVRKIISMSDITITEQKKIYQATVRVAELKEGDDSEYNSMMVFRKKKTDGDAVQWFIADID